VFVNLHLFLNVHLNLTPLLCSSDPLTAMVAHNAAFDSAVRFVRDIAEAVRYLHASRIVHLDIKPQNILVVPRDSASLGGVSSPIAAAGGGGTGAGQQYTRDAPSSPILRPSPSPSKSLSGGDAGAGSRDPVVLGFGDMWMPKISDMGLGKHVGDNTSSFMLSPASVMGLTRGGARGKYTGSSIQYSRLSTSVLFGSLFLFVCLFVFVSPMWRSYVHTYIRTDMRACVRACMAT
jgi:serine/threonine protein kinase